MSALAGPRSYDGEMKEFAFVNPTGNKMAGPDDIDAACTVLWRVWAVSLVVLFICALIGL